MRSPLPPMLAAFALTTLALGALLASTRHAPTTATGTKADPLVFRTIPETFAWPKLVIDPNTLATERAALPPAKPGPEVDALLKIVRNSNDHQFKTHPIPSKTVRELNDLARTQSHEVLGSRDPKGFVRLGDPLFAQCKRGIEQVRAAVSSGKLTIDVLRQDPPINEYRDYRRGCGNFISALLDLKLMRKDLTWADPAFETIAEILMRYRWLFLAHELLPARRALTPSELRAMMRWRIESPAYSTRERTNYLAEIGTSMPEYPLVFAAALIKHEGGQTDAAVTLLRKLQRDDPTHKIRYDRWIAEISGNGTGKK